jgi:hypothetical protein
MLMETSKLTFFLKGFKLDREKIRRQFPREENEPEGSYELSWYTVILDCITATAYKYIGLGMESDGHLNLVVVRLIGDLIARRVAICGEHSHH